MQINTPIPKSTIETNTVRELRGELAKQKERKIKSNTRSYPHSFSSIVVLSNIYVLALETMIKDQLKD